MDSLPTHPWLDFAGIAAPQVAAISAEQQFAEKLHAYTLPRQSQNSRVKDLVDMILPIDRCRMSLARLGDAITATFRRRRSHPVPTALGDPPQSWEQEYRRLAGECRLPGDVHAAIEKVRELFAQARTG